MKPEAIRFRLRFVFSLLAPGFDDGQTVVRFLECCRSLQNYVIRSWYVYIYIYIYYISIYIYYISISIYLYIYVYKDEGRERERERESMREITKMVRTPEPLH